MTFTCKDLGSKSGLDTGRGLTCQAVPLVDGKKAVGRNGDDGGHC